MRTCKVCKVVKNLDGFYTVVSRGVLYYRQVCKQYTDARVLAWHKAHPENMDAIRRRKESRPAYKAHRRVYKREWAASNPDKPLSYNRTRRALKHGAHGSLTPAEWREIVATQRGKCFDCGIETVLTVGHLVPLSRGGAHARYNIVGQCRSCNSRQGTHIHSKVAA